MFICCECCVLSGRGLCDELITHPEESYQVRCVWVWSWILDKEEAFVHWGLLHHGKKSQTRSFWYRSRKTIRCFTFWATYLRHSKVWHNASQHWYSYVVRCDQDAYYVEGLSCDTTLFGYTHTITERNHHKQKNKFEPSTHESAHMVFCLMVRIFHLMLVLFYIYK